MDKNTNSILWGAFIYLSSVRPLTKRAPKTLLALGHCCPRRVGKAMLDVIKYKETMERLTDSRRHLCRYKVRGSFSKWDRHERFPALRRTTR